MCGNGGAPQLGRNIVKEIFPVTALPCSSVNISLLSKIDQSQTHDNGDGDSPYYVANTIKGDDTCNNPSW